MSPSPVPLPLVLERPADRLTSLIVRVRDALAATRRP
jgi:hypothetical protein